MIRSRRRQKGETIVEVLVSIAILSAILGSVFAITTKSQRTVRGNADRYQAQLIANEQADRLKIAMNTAAIAATIQTDFSAAPNENSSATGTPHPAFCFKQSDSSYYRAPSLRTDTIDDTNCLNSRDGVVYALTITPFVRSASGKADTFLIRVSWDSASSASREKVELVYGT